MVNCERPNVTPCANGGAAPTSRPLARPIHVLAMPVGPECDLRCHYCYYRAKRDLFPADRHTRMSTATLATFIHQYTNLQPPGTAEVQFNWQGGEPTLAGIGFFEQARTLQRELAPPGITCTNTLQTHGLHLDDRWGRFLHDEQFLVGLSIDGPSDLHDRQRRDARDCGTAERVLAALRVLQQHDVATNALVVVHRDNAAAPERVYDFLVDAGLRHIQFIPLVTPSAAPIGVTPESVDPAQYGTFLCRVFDRWWQRDIGRVFVQGFENALAAWLGRPSTLCTTHRTCGDALVLEHNGDVFSCDHFVDADHRLGNIHETDLAQLTNAPQQHAFGRQKATLPPICETCEVRFACHGECPKNRIVPDADSDAKRNYLCAGFQRFYRHIDAPLRTLAAQLRSGRPITGATTEHDARPRADAPAPQRTGRNAPCPCGSGRKTKHCCGRVQV